MKELSLPKKEWEVERGWDGLYNDIYTRKISIKKDKEKDRYTDREEERERESKGERERVSQREREREISGK